MTDGGQTDTKAPAKPAEEPASQPAKVPRRRAQMERLVEADTRDPLKTEDGAQE